MRPSGHDGYQWHPVTFWSSEAFWKINEAVLRPPSSSERPLPPRRVCIRLRARNLPWGWVLPRPFRFSVGMGKGPPQHQVRFRARVSCNPAGGRSAELTLHQSRLSLGKQERLLFPRAKEMVSWYADQC